jgi:anaerobic magnesium-protoporphyrin IX monomethyl ester cyclase
MIRETAQIARAAKKLYPDLPVVLGGWHPSLLPDQTLAAECVDVVIRGQGEYALLEVMQRLEDRASLEGIPGVGYKEDGRLVFNQSQPLLPIRDLPPKAYHLADFNAYERTCGRRWAMYISSLACPYNCGYCTDVGVYGRGWNALEPEQVLSTYGQVRLQCEERKKSAQVEEHNPEAWECGTGGQQLAHTYRSSSLLLRCWKRITLRI